MKKISDIQVANKRVLLREDLNVPLKNGNITSSARLDAALPTIRTLLEQKACVLVMSHLGRPTPNTANRADFSLKPIADYLAKKLDYKVTFVASWEHIPAAKSGECLLLENVRSLNGETNNDEYLSKKMAGLGDIFVMDAFASAHRQHCSTYGVIKYIQQACAGPLLHKEINALSKIMHSPSRPLLAIVGGAKVSSKLNVLRSLSKTANKLIVGGGIANTFLAAAGYPTGASLVEKDMISTASEIAQKVDIPLPSDVLVSSSFDQRAAVEVKPINAIAEKDIIIDVGPATSKSHLKLVQQSRCILWNGPVGVVEFSSARAGTQKLAQAIAQSAAYSVVGGGDIIAALEKFNLLQEMSYVSTAGGAFLEFVAGQQLPALKALGYSPL